MQHVFILVAHSFGYAVSEGTVTFPGCNTPTRIGVRLERTGHFPNVELLLGALDGGKAKKADDVKFYELPASLELRIVPRLEVMDEKVLLGPRFGSLIGAALYGSTLLEAHLSAAPAVWGFDKARPEMALPHLWDVASHATSSAYAMGTRTAAGRVVWGVDCCLLLVL